MAAERVTHDLNSKDGRDIRAILSQTVVVQVLRAGRTLVILPLITRADLGIYRYVAVVLTYLLHLHFGAFSVFTLRYPELDAGQERERAEALRRLAWQASVGGSGVAMVVLFAVLWQLDEWAWPMVLVMSALGGLGLMAKHITDTYTVTQRFRERARIDATTAVVGFVLALAGAFQFGLTGFLLATLAMPSVRILLSRGLRMPKVRLPLEIALFRETFLTGARLWLSGVLSAARIGLDVLILKHVMVSGIEFGLYAFASVIAVTVSVVGNAPVQVHAIHLSRVIGKTGDVTSVAVRDQMERSLIRDYLAMVVIISGAAVALGIVVPLMLPAYEPALPLVGVFLAAASIQRWIKHPRRLLLIADRIRLANIGPVVAIVLTVVNIVVVSAIFDGNLFAYATTSEIAYLGGGITTLLITYRALGHGGHGRKFVGRLLLCATSMAPFNLMFLGSHHGPSMVAAGLLSGALALMLFRFLFPGTVMSTAVLFFPRLLATIRAAKRHR